MSFMIAFALPLVFIVSILGLGIGYSAWVEALDGLDGEDFDKVSSNVLVICICALAITSSWILLAHSVN